MKHSSPSSRVERGAGIRVDSDRLRVLWLAGFSALTVATPLVPSESSAVSALGLPFALFTLVLTLGWLLGMIASRNWDVRLGWSGTALLVFLGFVALSTIVQGPQGEMRQTLNQAWQWLSIALVYILGLNLIRTDGERRAVVGVMLGLSIGLSVYAIYQYKFVLPKTREEFKRNPEKVIAETGIVAPEGSSQRKQLEDRLNSSEPYGTFSLANSLAGFLTPWLLLGSALGYSEWARHRSQLTQSQLTQSQLTQSQLTQSDSAKLPWSARPLVFGFSVLGFINCLVLVVLLTKSRTAWVSIAGGLVLFLLFGRRGGWKPNWTVVTVGIGMTVTASLLAFVLGGLDWKIVGESSKSALYRLQYWAGTSGIISESPFFGCGPGNFQQAYTLHKLPEASESISDPHNFLFEIWGNLGTPALAAFIGIFIGMAYDIRSRLRGPQQDSTTRTEVHPSVARDQHSRSGEYAVYVGGLFGFFLAFPLGLVGGFMPDLDLWFTGLPATVAMVVVLDQWVRFGVLTPVMIAVPLVSLLVNLLGAGGISFSGVSEVIWILMALLVSPHLTRRPSSVLRLIPVCGLATVLTLLSIFWSTTYQPVQEREELTAAASFQLMRGNTRRAERLFLAAADADPYSHEPHFRLATIYHQLWMIGKDERHRESFELHERQMLDKGPRSYQLRLEAGKMWLQAYQQNRDNRSFERALARLRETIDLYPNSSLNHAYLAWALSSGPNRSDSGAAARRAAEMAIRLDDLSPHFDKKLANQSLFDGSNAEQKVRGLLGN